jgi:surface antigen
VNIIKKLTVVTVIAIFLSACATPPSKEGVGGVTGAVAGGILGAQVGKGRGRDAAMIAGAILGAVIGSSIGRSLDAQDEARAQQVLEYNRTGQYTHWVNPDTGADITMAPTRTYEPGPGQYCREYQTTVVVGGKQEQAYGTACRQPDGSWKIMQ